MKVIFCATLPYKGGAKLFKGGTKPSSSPSMRWAMNGLNSMFRRWLNVSSSILGEETFNIIFLSSWLTQYTLLALRVSSIVFCPPPLATTPLFVPFPSLPFYLLPSPVFFPIPFYTIILSTYLIKMTWFHKSKNFKFYKKKLENGSMMIKITSTKIQDFGKIFEEVKYKKILQLVLKNITTSFEKYYN